MGDNNSIYSSKRFEFSSLLLSGIMMTYILRVNMSIAVKSMADEYNWSNYQKGDYSWSNYDYHTVLLMFLILIILILMLIVLMLILITMLMLRFK